MDVVVIGPPADVIAKRHKLGLDLFDEVWDGEYHMVPTPTWDHQDMELRLAAAWLPLADAVGLKLVLEFNLIAPNEPGWRDFRVPDLVVFRADVAEQRGVIGAAELAVEIRSPGDESFEKLPFYERVGVAEVLIIDRDTKAIRHWVHDGTVLVEHAPDATGRHRLRCLPVELRTDDGHLIVNAAGTITTI